MHHDRRGLPVSVSNAQALRYLEEATTAFVGHRPAAANYLRCALEADPHFVLALCLKGFAGKLLAHAELADGAAAAALAAREAADAFGATWRERAYVDALMAWCEGNPVAAAYRLGSVIDAHPHDLLAIKLHHAIAFQIGDHAEMRRGIDRAAAAWTADVPGYGAVLGCLAFVDEEAGLYDRAERIGRLAVDLDPTDIWAVHAVAHVYEMTARPQSGLSWLGERSGAVAGCNNMVFHLAWHEALFCLDQADAARALDLYDRAVRVTFTDDYRDMANAASLLWRLRAMGVDGGARWTELAEKSAARIGDGSLAFASLHYLFSLVGAVRRRAALRLVATMRRIGAGAERLDAGVATDRPSWRLAAAIGDLVLAAGRPEEGSAFEIVLAARRSLPALGGSHAQRDVFVRHLIEAAIRLDRRDAARTLLAERAERRLPDAWARAMEARLSRGARGRRVSWAEDARAVP